MPKTLCEEKPERSGSTRAAGLDPSERRLTPGGAQPGTQACPQRKAAALKLQV